VKEPWIGHGWTMGERALDRRVVAALSWLAIAVGSPLNEQRSARSWPARIRPSLARISPSLARIRPWHERRASGQQDGHRVGEGVPGAEGAEFEG
jgi:hypothetical protein